MKKRWLSVDIFRGLTVILMIIVNSPGNQTSYRYLEHSAWNGCTLADLVFPFFVIIVGISVVLSLAHQRNLPALLPKLMKRTVILFGIGLFLNAFPHHFDVSNLRIPGVLQRIAICYFFSAVMYLTTRVRTQAIVMVALLIVYGCVMTMLGAYDLSMEGNLAAYLDKLVFSSHHMYSNAYDPEGLFSTLPALATVLLGNLIGVWLISSTSYPKQQFCTGMILGGLIVLVTGWFWAFIFPINKALWSSSYVLWTGGLAMLSYAACYWLVEIKHWKNGTWAFELFGTNALLIFVLHVFFLKLQASTQLLNTQGKMVSLKLYLTDYLFGWAPSQMASLLYAFSYMLLWLLVLIVIWLSKQRARLLKINDVI